MTVTSDLIQSISYAENGDGAAYAADCNADSSAPDSSTLYGVGGGARVFELASAPKPRSSAISSNCKLILRSPFLRGSSCDVWVATCTCLGGVWASASLLRCPLSKRASLNCVSDSFSDRVLALTRSPSGASRCRGIG